MAKMAVFFQKCMAKITNRFNYGNVYIHRCLKLFGNRKAVYCLPKKCAFAKEASFYPKTTIYAVNLKLPVKTFLYLSY